MPTTSRFQCGTTPIVVLGDDWGRHVSTLQHLFRHVSQRTPVVWVNSFGHRRPRLTVSDFRRAVSKIARMVIHPERTLDAAGSSHPQIDGSLPASIIEPRALPWHDKTWVARLNAWSLRRDIRAALDRVAPNQRPLLVTGTPTAWALLGRLDEVASIYFCIDDYGEIHGVDSDLLRNAEVETSKRVGAVVATAKVLTETRRPSSGRAYHLPQGVNFKHFAERRGAPAALAKLPKPIIGFAGGIGPAIDAVLLRSICSAFPDASVVLIGPIQEPLPFVLPSNLHIVGAQPYEHLPAFVQAFDVGIIPYVLNRWTAAVDPLKLLEYLAAGIPVVTTALPEAHKYSTSVRIATDHTSFISAISDEINAPPSSRDHRRETAAANQWSRRAERFLEIAAEVSS